MKGHIKAENKRRDNFTNQTKKKNCISVLESKQNDLKIINSTKNYPDLKKSHEILPEKQINYDRKNPIAKKYCKNLQILQKSEDMVK